MRRCPNCERKLYWDYWEKRFQCPKIRGGCGWIPKSRQTTLVNKTPLI